eukprot:CAMPEP_0115598262 /NCGR_PEP_ID=MMETSP0272-20121206/13783_1 /TAXON_ID=71861 /ORGANISM="Scrippsiella trochoidea, Strain CCMP3099" /LENGTH=138 /DNA_ID=CAMNT_0003033671 /DNA_START=872 /DNA_END=1288 /DNA_ORIENTATION=-
MQNSLLPYGDGQPGLVMHAAACISQVPSATRHRPKSVMFKKVGTGRLSNSELGFAASKAMASWAPWLPYCHCAWPCLVLRTKNVHESTSRRATPIVHLMTSCRFHSLMAGRQAGRAEIAAARLDALLMPPPKTASGHK